MVSEGIQSEAEDIEGIVEEEEPTNQLEQKRRDREPGRSLLPFARVQKIIKVDKVRSITELQPSYFITKIL